MSKQEFDLYLSLLSRFLRLNAGQRTEIADELRDHLEERLDELKASGLSQADAVRRALDEFGDAAELATHFTQLAQRRRRRIIMRSTVASIAAASAVILISFAFWPADPGGQIVPRVDAQQPVAPSPIAKTDSASRPVLVSKRDLQREAIETKLATQLEELSYVDVSLQDVLNAIGDEVGVDIILNESSLQEEGIDTDQPVNLSVKHAKISAAAAIELVLGRATKRGQLTYVIRDGLVYIQTAATTEEELEIEVYNVRDLLAGVKPLTRTAFPGGAGLGSDASGGGGLGGGTGGLGGGGGGFGTDAQGKSANNQVSPGELLSEVISETTAGPWIDVDGVGGTVKEFDGMLVIRQTQKSHREIKQLLAMLRATSKELPAKR